MNRHFPFMTGLILLLGFESGNAQTETPMIMPRLSGPISLDGLSDEPAWETIPPLPVTMRI
ncbi:hypothetical protein ACFLZR_01355, partial [Candidatus Neomarinimicrobiota bacterium]